MLTGNLPDDRRLSGRGRGRDRCVSHGTSIKDSFQYLGQCCCILPDESRISYCAEQKRAQTKVRLRVEELMETDSVAVFASLRAQQTIKPPPLTQISHTKCPLCVPSRGNNRDSSSFGSHPHSRIRKITPGSFRKLRARRAV